MKSLHLTWFLWLAFFAIPVAAQSPGFFPLESVEPGLKGTGKTVFQGTRVEEFDVEILGVLAGIGPKQNMIIARLSGEQVAEFGVFAGMSGSPVYVDGRLLGAVAYAFSFATQPIAGITPIHEMVDVFKERNEVSFELAQKQPVSHLYEIPSQPPQWLSYQPGFGGVEVRGFAPEMSRFGEMHPIKTPLNLVGVSQQTLSSFLPYLHSRGWTPVLGGAAVSGADWDDVPLEPGSTVAVQLIRGDMEVSASGTVTYLSGNKVYAFGHPFMGIGFTDLPLTKAAVLGVIPNLMNSQKISAVTTPIGSIRQDRATGILGFQGESPRLIPLELKLKSGRNRDLDFEYEIVTDTFLTPFLVAFAVQNSIVSSERAVGGQTIQVKCNISLEGQPEIQFETSVSDMMSSSALAAVSAASPVGFIMSSGFDEIRFEKIEFEISAVEQTQEAVLTKVWQDRIEAKPGEEVGVTVFLRKPNGEIESEKYPIKIPEGLTPGPLKIMIGDGLTITRIDAQTEKAEFIPKDLGQLVRAINNLKKNDRLYIRLYREEQGAVIAGQGLPGLPPSILALYGSKKASGDIQPINRVVFVEHELPATNYVLQGSEIIEINIEG